MRIPLSEFEQHVRPEPLERGLGLYERGQVEAIRNLGKGRLEAVVQDADGTWHPELQITNDVVVGTQCACGQAGDSLCRHAIAVVFAMEAGQFKEGITTKSGKVAKEKVPGKGVGRPQLDDAPLKKAPKIKAIKPPKPPKTAADIIARVPHEELVAFLLQECKLDKNIEVRLKAHFSDLLPAATPADLEKRIAETIKAAVGKSGRVNKGSMAVLIKRLDEWAMESGRLIDAQSYELAFAAAKSVIQAMVDVTDSPHAIDADTKRILKVSIDTIDRIGTEALPEAERIDVFLRALAMQQGGYRNSAYLRLLSRVCTKGGEFETVEKLFTHYHDDFPLVTQAHLEMVRRVLGDASAQEFAKKHANARYFLALEIDEARKQGQLTKAIKVAQKGLSLNQNHPSRLGHWANLVDELLAEAGDIDGRVELALRIYRLGYKTDRVALKHIADIAGRERWVAERGRLIQDMDARKDLEQEKIVGLFQLDQDIDGLERYLSSMALSSITSWSDVLRKRFPELYWSVLTQSTALAFSKKASVSSNLLTNLIREMVRLKGKGATQASIAALAQQYPKNAVLVEVSRGIQQVMRYMYEGY